MGAAVGGLLIVEHSLGDLGRSLVLPASRQHLWPHVMRLRHRRLRIGRPGMLARIGARRRVDREEIGMGNQLDLPYATVMSSPLHMSACGHFGGGLKVHLNCCAWMCT